MKKQKKNIKLRMKICEGFISDGKFELYLTKEFQNLLKHFRVTK